MLLNERRPLPTTSRFPGNGKPVYSDYESLTVTLQSTFAQQKGSFKFTVPAEFVACATILVDFVIRDRRTPANMTKCPCHISGTAEIFIPNPAPADLSAYVAAQVKRHSVLLSNALMASVGDTMSFTMLRAGYELEMKPRANADGKVITIARTETQVSSYGNVPNIGAGSAVFQHPSIKSKSPLRALVGTLGWSAAPTGVKPRFLGVRRQEDVLANNECECTWIEDVCDTAFIEGILQIPLEVSIAELPDDPVLYARHSLDVAGGFTTTGGYQVLTATAPAPAGMVKVPNVQFLDHDGNKLIINLH